MTIKKIEPLGNEGEHVEMIVMESENIVICNALRSYLESCILDGTTVPIPNSELQMKVVSTSLYEVMRDDSKRPTYRLSMRTILVK